MWCTWLLDGGRTYLSKLPDDYRQEDGHGGRGDKCRRRSCRPHVVVRLKHSVLGDTGVSRALHRCHTAAGRPIFFPRAHVFAMRHTNGANERIMPSSAAAVATATTSAVPFVWEKIQRKKQR